MKLNWVNTFSTKLSIYSIFVQHFPLVSSPIYSTSAYHQSRLTRNVINALYELTLSMKSKISKQNLVRLHSRILGYWDKFLNVWSKLIMVLKIVQQHSARNSLWLWRLSLNLAAQKFMKDLNWLMMKLTIGCLSRFWPTFWCFYLKIVNLTVFSEAFLLAQNNA